MLFEMPAKWVGGWLGLESIKEKNKILSFLGIAMGGILIALQALASYRRAKAMEDSSLHIESGQRQERLKNAIEHLGHNSDSVRLAGAYELFHLAEDNKELRQTVLDILCAHIRWTTSEKKYRKNYQSRPSEEIQSLLTLLFVKDHRIFSGYHINLQGSWLNGANLEHARLTDADLSHVYLETANLSMAKMQATNLEYANLIGVNLNRANMQNAYLAKTKMQITYLLETQMQAARFWDTEMQGAIFSNTQMQGANFEFSYYKMFKMIIRHSVGVKADLSQIRFGDTKDTNKIPKGVITEPYTREDAEQWIYEYNDAISKTVNPKQKPLPHKR